MWSASSGYICLVGVMVLVGVVLCHQAPVQAVEADGPRRLVLKAGRDSYLLGPHLEILEDRSGHLDIDQVSRPPWSGRFHPLRQSTINRGASPSAYWLRWRVVAEADAGFQAAGWGWLLDVGQPSLAYVSLYTPRTGESGGGWRRLPTLCRNLRRFPPPSRFAVFMLPLVPGRSRSFYLRLQSTSVTILAPRVYSLQGFLEYNRSILLLQGVFCGIILALAVYNLVIFVSLRDSSYLWYVLATVSMAFYYLGWGGLVQDYLTGLPPALVRHLPIAFLSSLFFCRGLFACHFLLTRRQAPRLDRLILWASMLTAGLALVVPLSGGILRLWAIRLTAALILGWPVLLMGAAAWRRRQGFQPATFFLLAYSVTAVGVVVYLLLMLGLIPFRELYFAAHQLGGTLEAILLSLALGYRIRNLREQRRRAEDVARESRMQHRLVMESAPYPLVVCDVAGRITYLNPAFCRVFGWSLGEAAGTSLWEVLAGGGAGGSDALARERDFRGLEARCQTREGRELQVNISAAVFRSADGQARGRVFILEDISERKRSEAALAAYQRRLRELALELTTAEERQRRRIAEDLHDGVSQSLAAASFRLKHLGTELESVTRNEVDQVARLLDRSLADIRSLTFEISPPVLYDYGLPAALEWLAGRVGRRHALVVEHRIGEMEPALDADRQVSLFRACQELLVNVVKHAGAERVRISFFCRKGAAWLVVADDGRGFDPAVLEERGGGFGLFSIRERLEPLGGKMRIDSAPGRGTRVILRLPAGGSRGEG